MSNPPARPDAAADSPAAAAQTSTDRPPSHRLLLVTYWYPPAIGAAAERMAAFARALPRYGWRVDVLTARRSAPAPAASHVAIHEVNDPQGGAVETFADYDPRHAGRIDWKRYLRDFVFPDRFRRWMRAAVRHVETDLTTAGYSAVLASFPPASAAALGMHAARLTGAPLFLDFRDGWFGPGGYQPRYAFARRRHADLYAEVVRAAAGVVTVSDTLTDDMAAAHGLPRERIAVVPNGFDPALPPMPQPPGPPADDQPLIIAHVGTVIPRNRPDLFLAALQHLPAADRAAVRFRFVGNLSADFLRDAGIATFVESTGLLPREAAWRRIADAHALLLLVGRDAGHWTPRAKLFEYLATGRPVLCLEESPDSFDHRLLASLAPQRTFRAAVGDATGISGAIGRLRDFCRSGEAADFAPPPALAAYNRETLTGRLAAFLEARMAG